MLCIRNGKLVLPGGVKEADLYVRHGKIFSVGGYLGGAEVYDARGCYVFPGFIDSRAYLGMDALRTPTADDFASGTEAAVASGVTTVAVCTAQHQGASLLEAVDSWSKLAHERCSSDYCFHVGVTEWRRGLWKELEKLAEAGIPGALAWLSGAELRLDEKTLKKVLQATAKTGFVGVYCEQHNDTLWNAAAALSRGETEAVYSATVRPNRSEATAVRRCLEAAAEVGAPVWIAPVTTAEALEEIRAARARGQFVLAETDMQYLTLGSELLTREGGENFVCLPPLRSRRDREALWQALSAGEIQLIASGHCAFSAAAKKRGSETDFTQIPAGLPTLDVMSGLLWSEGVHRGRMEVEDMARLLSEFPAKALGLYPRKGAIKTGADADLVVWDPAWAGTVSGEAGHSRAGYSPWEGTVLRGRAKAVFLRGELTAAQGTVLRFGQGIFQKREPVF